MCAPAAIADSELSDTHAFRVAYATSFYNFDGCGDEIGGRLYREALADKFAHCPFTPEARTRYRDWSQAQHVKAAAALQQMIEDHGGMPMRLDGMARTCHEQAIGADYQAMRQALERHAQGEISAEDALPGSCEAP